MSIFKEKPAKFFWPFSSSSFSCVRGNWNCASSHLTCQTIYFFFKILVDFYSYFFLKHYLWLFLLKYHHIVALYALNVSGIKYPPSLSFRNNISCRNFTDTYSWQYKYKVWFLIYSECNFSIIGDHEKNNSYTTFFLFLFSKNYFSL